MSTAPLYDDTASNHRLGSLPCQLCCSPIALLATSFAVNPTSNPCTKCGRGSTAAFSFLFLLVIGLFFLCLSVHKRWKICRMPHDLPRQMKSRTHKKVLYNYVIDVLASPFPRCSHLCYVLLELCSRCVASIGHFLLLLAWCCRGCSCCCISGFPCGFLLSCLTEEKWNVGRRDEGVGYGGLDHSKKCSHSSHSRQ